MVWTVGKRPVSASEKQGYVKEKSIRDEGRENRWADHKR